MKKYSTHVLPTLTSIKGLGSGIEILNEGITVETSFKISGTAAPGQNIEVFDGEVSKGEATSDTSTGEWRLSIGGLTPSTYSFTAKTPEGLSSSPARTFTLLQQFFIEEFVDYPEGPFTTLETYYMTITSAAEPKSYLKIINSAGEHYLYFVRRVEGSLLVTMDIKVPCSSIEFKYKVYSGGTPDGVFTATFYDDKATLLETKKISAVDHTEYEVVAVEQPGIKRVEFSLDGASAETGNLLTVSVDNIKFTAQS
ncbi:MULTISPECIES: hypothetical protein [unclassified Pseudomonas]|jgi:hypothetical protein|uniref:hypothetical protein n=1 Tax=unclassified Pseudomonas TaxID=196821 RepID=UPI00027026E0|nr:MULTISPECIES: hypothetical protein [unclassified Pseudomonas]EJM00704.1 hypothetical protein PMI19_03648 [Pseudomonas sp. GM16]EJM42267.1 hypothetical protein PMI23_01533 [Pseudomonas sp. GM24]